MFISINIQKVIREIFLNPTKEQSIRDISKKVKLVPATVSKIVKELKKHRIIKIKEVAKSMLVSADLESEAYKFYKRLFNILSLKEIADEIAKENPLSIILYGSYAKGEDIESSDIDIAVIGPEFSIDTKIYEKNLNRKMHLLFFKTEKDIPMDLRQNLMNGFMLSGGIIL